MNDIYDKHVTYAEGSSSPFKVKRAKEDIKTDIRKISTFFSIQSFKEKTENKTFFAPFCLKNSCFLAPINRFILNDDQHKSIGSKSKCIYPDGRIRNRKIKIIQFYENIRPAYYGTLKGIKKINFKNPLNKYNLIKDYDVDSEMEWEDINDAESISSIEKESDLETEEEDLESEERVQKFIKL